MSDSVWRLRGDPLALPTGTGPLDGLRLADDVEARFRYGDSVTAADEMRARALLRDWRAEVGEWLSGAWLALPAACGPGHPRVVTVADKDAWRVATLRRTVLASACGLPSAVLPLRTAEGPQGLAFVGAAGDDHGLLEALARAA